MSRCAPHSPSPPVPPVIGASARWAVGEALASDGFPWATLS
jgi:fluoride ion exporter CrcB/FEX